MSTPRGNSSETDDVSVAKSLVEVLDESDDQLLKELEKMSTPEMIARISLMNNEIRIMQNEIKSIGHQTKSMKQKISANKRRLRSLFKLPLLVADISQLCENKPGERSNKQNSGIIVKTSTRRTIFLPDSGLVERDDIKPGDRVCTDKDTFTLVSTLPKDIDPRVKAMEVVERPTETYADIGGLDKQIEELIEAVVLPITHREKFEALGVRPPKGVLLYGAPGTGKTLVARACANQTRATFLKLAGSQLVQGYIGEGARLVREAFYLAKSKAPSIVFVDEIDAIGGRRGGPGKAGDREVHRTLIELLNQMDGFSCCGDVKFIGATNRVDVIDPALLRSGRMDRKIEFPEPDECARIRVIKIHSRNLRLAEDVNFEELGRTTEGFTAAMCKALCTEAAMAALRRQDGHIVTHEDFISAISEVIATKKFNRSYYS